MMRFLPSSSRRVALGSLFVALALVVGACSDDTTPTRSAAGSDELNGFVRAEPLQVGDIKLPEVTSGTPAGTKLTMKPADGHLLVVYFGYTNCPDVCPTTLSALRRAYRKIGAAAEPVETAMVTVDPRRDTADVLNNYVASFFSERYHVIRTQDMAELKHAEDAFLARSTVLYPAVGEPQVSHTGTTYVVDPSGTVVVEWPFGLDAESMAHDLQILLKRSSSSA